ncbi:MAG: histidinol-phosphate transaminase [Elusimicrobia bacterium]|nr:histidinol-phosphate transaminase [Elusimicrobiota bacterium]
MKNCVRKNVLSCQPYIPGKPMEDVKREFKLKEVIKLASNENSLGPSKKAVLALRKVLNNVNIYPDGYCFDLRSKVACIYGVCENQIIFGSGIDEIIELLGKTFLNPEDEIVVSEHAFVRYKMAGDLMDCKVVEVPMKNYKHDLEAMADAVTEKTKIVFIANPNNPTGTYNTKQEFEKYFNKLLTANYSPLTFVDEAYAEYVDENDCPVGMEYLKKGLNVMFARTFSKIYGLAGLRIGYGISSEEVISYIERIRPPFNVSSVAQIAAAAALSDRQHMKKSRALVLSQKKYLYKELEKIGLEYVPTAANFILINVKSDGKTIFNKLLRKGIIVRAMDEYDFKDFIRVTIGLPSENKKFIKELKQCII